MLLKFDIYQTVALAVIIYFIGKFIKSKVNFLNKYCIPSPVVGGVLFAILSLILRQTGLLSFEFDTTLQSVFMVTFFTSVGFTASFKVLKKGLMQIILLLSAAVMLILLQNTISVGLSYVFDLEPLIGITTGSISMVGGHGTSASFGPLLEKMGASGANAVAIASATFGLIAGGMLGGPIGKRLIEKHNLKANPDDVKAVQTTVEDVTPLSLERTILAVSVLFIVMGVGSFISSKLVQMGLTFPPYIGAMLFGTLLRNIVDMTKFELPFKEIDVIGNLSLTIFISMALMSLRLWELLDLALPMIVLLIAQTLLMAIFSYFVVFNMCGRDYDAAVLSCAICGFGMGATPNAIANMDAVTTKYGYSAKAYFVVPIVGSMFIDIINPSIIAIFINLFK